jgi:hypothetical protein
MWQYHEVRIQRVQLVRRQALLQQSHGCCEQHQALLQLLHALRERQLALIQKQRALVQHQAEVKRLLCKLKQQEAGEPS